MLEIINIANTVVSTEATCVVGSYCRYPVFVDWLHQGTIGGVAHMSVV